MQTRLSLLCEGMIEATSLAAVVLAPLFFNTTTSTVFELDKAALVRILAWLVALAWLVQRLETRGAPPAPRLLATEDLRTRFPPLVLPAILVLMTAALASLASVAPRISFWGSLGRAQGLYTTLAYIVLFLAAGRALRRRDHIARLVTATLVTSLPVALYALAQALQLDPIRWPARAVGRPSSSIGNPIFVGEYLVMVLPLTIVALVAAWWAVRRRAGLSRYLILSSLIVLVGLQLAGIVVTQSRGPFLGLLAAMVFLGLVLAARAGNRRLLGGVAVAAMTVVGLLVLINLPGSPLAAVHEIPYVGRLAQALNPQVETAQERAMQWQAGVDLVTSNPARLVVGYGPDTTSYTIGPFIPAELINRTPERRTDRMHNEFLEALAAGGLISLAAYLALFLSAMRLGLTELGLLNRSTRGTWLLVAVSLGGGLLAGVAGWLLAERPAFLAPASGLGLVLGLGFYLLVSPFLADTTGARALPGTTDKDRLLLIAGLLAALVGHLVALQFSFGVVATRTLFWLYLALLAALTARADLLAAPQSTPGTGSRRRRRRDVTPSTEEPEPAALLASVDEDRLARSLLMGLILGVLLADFLLTGVALQNRTLLGLVGLTWVVGGVLTLTGAGGGLKLDRSGLPWPLLSLGWGLLFPLLLALIRLVTVRDPTVFYLLFLVWLGLTLGGLILTLSRSPARRLPVWRSGRWPWYLVLALVAGLAISLTNVRVIRADIYSKMAQIQHDVGRWDASAYFYRRALALAPVRDDYYSELAQAYLSQARATTDADQRTTALEKALEAMRQATELAPGDVNHLWNLGRLYRTVAEQTPDPARRQMELEQALASLQRAIALGPNRASLYVEQGQVYLALERYEDALEASRQALARNRRSAEAHVLQGDAYRNLGQLTPAEESYRQALALKRNPVAAHRGLAQVYLERGEPEAARDEALAALRIGSTDYAALETLARAYQALGSIQEAVDAARQAHNYAPPSEKAALEALIAELEAIRTR